MKKSLNNIEGIRNTFKDEGTFEKALTHRSWVNENKGTRENYERLEFLGDAVLEFIVSSFIYKKFPDKEEININAKIAIKS